MSWRALISGLGFAVASLVAAPVASQDIDAIRERARELKEYARLLRDASDPQLRLAAIEQGLASDDPLRRRQAFDIALDSDDEGLIYLALRSLLESRSQLIVTLGLPAQPTEAQEQLYKRVPRLMLYDFSVTKSGEITSRSSAGGSMKGSFIRKGFELTYAHTGIRITGVSSTVLSGSFDAGPGTELQAQILLD